MTRRSSRSMRPNRCKSTVSTRIAPTAPTPRSSSAWPEWPSVGHHRSPAQQPRLHRRPLRRSSVAATLCWPYAPYLPRAALSGRQPECPRAPCPGLHRDPARDTGAGLFPSLALSWCQAALRRPNLDHRRHRRPDRRFRFPSWTRTDPWNPGRAVPAKARTRPSRRPSTRRPVPSDAPSPAWPPAFCALSPPLSSPAFWPPVGALGLDCAPLPSGWAVSEGVGSSALPVLTPPRVSVSGVPPPDPPGGALIRPPGPAMGAPTSGTALLTLGWLAAMSSMGGR